ncbi:hypothetical protein HMPREF1624_06467 [Sporothrix schenckii ATCC 58251]|uniref:Trafficking protein particle complex subunit 6B n=1 Tax=Sporothrix schenckii (strain ATCC 58251 / de Perez 2211183) TaxID=1391915 RepID=U7PNH4_SPOS1|nr:hypothetical protein HMPREF1624_06467 [Sporothrix schenckii ATCC 58251]
MSFDPVLPPFNAGDPGATFFNSSCLDFLLIELVPMAYRVTNELEAGAQARSLAVAAAEAGLEGAAPHPDAQGTAPGAAAAAAAAAGAAGATGSTAAGAPAPDKVAAAAGSTAGTGTGAATGTLNTTGPGGGRRLLDEDEERDAVFYRLEMLGYRVGQGLVERFSRERPRFHDTLDVIKFLCKDLWTLVFRKQVDNLKTNHRGVYVLTDNAFRPFQRMSTEAGGQAVVRAQPFLWFPCGIVRGALAALGITATVQAESNELPGAIFQIKTIPAKA